MQSGPPPFGAALWVGTRGEGLVTSAAYVLLAFQHVTVIIPPCAGWAGPGGADQAEHQPPEHREGVRPPHRWPRPL